MTEQPSVPSDSRIPATFEATTPQDAAPRAAGAQSPGDQLTDSRPGAPRPRHAPSSAPVPPGPPVGAAADPAVGRPVDSPVDSAAVLRPDEAAVSAADGAEDAAPDGPAPAQTGPSTDPTAKMPTPPTAKKPNRVTLIGGVGLAYLVLAAGTAAAVVAVASPAPANPAAQAGPATTATAPGGAAGGGTTGGKPTLAAPTSTVTGTVSDGVHHGDLRFFLLPAPGGASSVQGDPDGTAENETTVVGEYSNTSDSSEITQVMHHLGFQAGADRTYQDTALGANVTVELLQFGSHDDAAKWLGAFQGSAPAGASPLTIPAEAGSTGWSSTDETDGTYSLTGLFVEGDTFFNVTVVGDEEIDDSSLSNLMTEQYSRLANG